MAKSLADLMTLHGSDKCQFHHDGTGHSYGPVYAELLDDRRESLAAVLEVGVLGGASLWAWREWVSPACRVVGIDNNLTCPPIPGVELYACDSRDPEAVRLALDDSTFDLIVDDGGHALDEQRDTYAVLWPRVRPGGLYLCEDLQSNEAVAWFAEHGAFVFNNNHLTGRWDDMLAVMRKPGT